MMKNRGPISTKLPHLWHGGDYNPDQWLHDPAVLEEDVRLMRLAGCNAMSVAIFAWTALEPEEGRYDLGWLDGVIDRLHAAGIFTVLATPSGARPAWMAEKYPEVLRVQSDGRRNLFGVRHNHCFTSPVYRRKVLEINSRLADALRPASGRAPLAPLQRVRRGVPLRPVPGGVPRLAAAALRRRPRRAEPRLVGLLLEPHLHLVDADRLPRAARRAVRARAEPGLETVRHRPDRRLHAARRSRRSRPRRPTSP